MLSTTVQLINFYRSLEAASKSVDCCSDATSTVSLRFSRRKSYPIEYSFGPSYVFSGRDEEALDDRLKQPRIELDGASLELLGWWHSHTRTSIELTEEDLRIHKSFSEMIGRSLSF